MILPGPGQSPSLGPILRWRGEGGDGTIRLDVTIVGKRPVALTVEPPLEPSEGGAFHRIGTLAGEAFWSASLCVPAAHGGPVHFTAGGTRRTAHLPARGGMLRLAFAACNGAEDDAAVDALPGGRAHLWRHLAARHRTDSFHLLVLGGDQIYADALWKLPSIRAWSAQPRRKRLAAPFTETMRAELETHYLAAYAAAFGDPAVADVLASIPSLMIWDDHDIVDGWGSRPGAWQASPVARGLFETARRAFCLMQLGRDPDRHGAPYGWHGVAGCARLIVPDLRSERSRARVMGEAGHRLLAEALAAAKEPHALVVASVPLVNADLSPLERLVAPVQPLADLYQDDLRDQWMSYRHRREWAGVMGPLLDLASQGVRVTILSGEIHLGAHGTIERDGAGVEQFIASGIAHPPPPRNLARVYETFARLTRRRAGLRIDMRPITGDGRCFVSERNWLEVALHPNGVMDPVLHAEESGPLPLVEARSHRRKG